MTEPARGARWTATADRVGWWWWLAIAACSGPARPAPISNTHGVASGSGFAITLERTPCFGTCPSYRVTVHSDGRVDWHGDAHVAARGARHATVDAGRVAALFEHAERAQFFERDDQGRLSDPARCTTQGAHTRCDFDDIVICSDISRAVIEIVRAGKRHRVTNEHCQDSPLDALEAEIDAVAGTRGWVGDR